MRDFAWLLADWLGSFDTPSGLRFEPSLGDSFFSDDCEVPLARGFSRAAAGDFDAGFGSGNSGLLFLTAESPVTDLTVAGLDFGSEEARDLYADDATLGLTEGFDLLAETSGRSFAFASGLLTAEERLTELTGLLGPFAGLTAAAGETRRRRSFGDSSLLSGGFRCDEAPDFGLLSWDVEDSRLKAFGFGRLIFGTSRAAEVGFLFADGDFEEVSE